MVLFAADRVRYDIVALILTSALMLTGVLDVTEGLSGFSNPATVTIAAMFGGVCTLLSTSTNILVSSIAAENGLEPFAMFEFAPFGLIVLSAGFLYFRFLGIRMVPPRRKTEDPTRDFNTVDYLSDIRVTDDSPYLGKSLGEMEGLWRLDIEVVFLYRDGEPVSDKKKAVLKEGDVLRIRGDVGEIHRLIQRRPGLEILPTRTWKDVDVGKGDYELLEAVVAPDSEYDSRKVKDIDVAGNYEAVVLGLYKRGKPEQDALGEIRLGGGDIYKAVNWKVIFLLAGVIPLGAPMQKTGAARLLADLIFQTAGHLGPRAVLSGFFLLTNLLTAVISNQATAAVLASLAIDPW
jgi:di/tricarboxylate transporter